MLSFISSLFNIKTFNKKYNKMLNKFILHLIALGCLVTVFLNIEMNRKSNKINNFYSWLIVCIVSIIIIIMMYLISNGSKQMTIVEKT